MAETHWQKSALDAVLGECDSFVDDEILPLVVADMQRLVPVDSGELRDSIEAVGGGRIVIGKNYAGYVEFGTERMAAQPYARPAIYRRRSA